MGVIEGLDGRPRPPISQFQPLQDAKALEQPFTVLFSGAQVIKRKIYRRNISMLPNINTQSPCYEIGLALHHHFAHVGRDKVLDLLHNLVWHPLKYSVVSDICTTCHDCQILKAYSTSVQPPTLKIVTHFPFQLLAADLINLSQTSSGYVACLVVVDHYSKWSLAVPLKNKRSVSVIDAFKNRVLPTLPRQPTTVLTDNGPEFISVEFGAFLEKFGIAHQFTTPLCPSSNGAVERCNRTIQQFIRVLTDAAHTWDDVLAQAMISYNSTLHAELGVSPAEFLLTKAHEVSVDSPVNGQLSEKWKQGHPKFLPFEPGQAVLYKVHQHGNLTSNKLNARFDGPYIITKTNSNGVTYEMTLPGSTRVVRAHHSQLRIYKYPPKYLSDHSSVGNDCNLANNNNNDVNLPCTDTVALSCFPDWDLGHSSSSESSFSSSR